MKKINLLLCSIVFVLTCLITGTSVHAADDTSKTKQKEDYSPPLEKESRKKKPVNTPKLFIPSDRVSADRAVAFPTDI